jgi:hypothetical protein
MVNTATFLYGEKSPCWAKDIVYTRVANLGDIFRKKLLLGFFGEFETIAKIEPFLLNITKI